MFGRVRRYECGRDLVGVRMHATVTEVLTGRGCRVPRPRSHPAWSTVLQSRRALLSFAVIVFAASSLQVLSNPVAVLVDGTPGSIRSRSESSPSIRARVRGAGRCASAERSASGACCHRDGARVRRSRRNSGSPQLGSLDAARRGNRDVLEGGTRFRASGTGLARHRRRDR